MLCALTKTCQSTCNLTDHHESLKCTKSYRSLLSTTSDPTLTLLVNDWGLLQPHPYQQSGVYLQGMLSKSSNNKISSANKKQKTTTKRNILNLNLATMLLKIVSFIASPRLPLLLCWNVFCAKVNHSRSGRFTSGWSEVESIPQEHFCPVFFVKYLLGKASSLSVHSCTVTSWGFPGGAFFSNKNFHSQRSYDSF